MFRQKSRLDMFLQFSYLTALSSHFLRLNSRFLSHLLASPGVNRAICNVIHLGSSTSVINNRSTLRVVLETYMEVHHETRQQIPFRQTDHSLHALHAVDFRVHDRAWLYTVGLTAS